MQTRVNTKTFRDLATITEITKGKTIHEISRELNLNPKTVDKTVTQNQALLTDIFERVTTAIAQDVIELTQLSVLNLKQVMSLQCYHSDRDRIMAVNSFLKLLEITGQSATCGGSINIALEG